MDAYNFCEITCMDVSPLKDFGIFGLWMRRMPEYRRRKVTSLRNPESQRLSLGVGLLLHVALGEKGIDGTAAKFAENEFGQPYLPEHPNLHFSLSHAGSWAMCAVSDRPVGCDVEQTGRGSPALAERFFHPEEREALAAENDPKKWDQLFTRLWTRKEAYLKASGKGLSLPLNSFSALEDTDTVHYGEKAMAPGYGFSVCLFGPASPRLKWDEVRLT